MNSSVVVASQPVTICLLPEELRQQIIGELNYYDAWALKQTCKLFERVVEIPTVKSFFRWPNGETLTYLREWDVVPITHEAVVTSPSGANTSSMKDGISRNNSVCNAVLRKGNIVLDDGSPPDLEIMKTKQWLLAVVALRSPTSNAVSAKCVVRSGIVAG
ncbi:hypothetical protein MMC07_002272 [Pseudocyphellaria aurata]|nr:hypothetical protein [Pseudocyphellaria aurata]